MKSLDMSRIIGDNFMQGMFNIARRIDGTSTPKYDELIAEIKKLPDEKDMKPQMLAQLQQQQVETTSPIEVQPVDQSVAQPAGGGIKGKSKKKKLKKSKTYKKRKGKKH